VIPSVLLQPAFRVGARTHFALNRSSLMLALVGRGTLWKTTLQRGLAQLITLPKEGGRRGKITRRSAARHIFCPSDDVASCAPVWSMNYLGRQRVRGMYVGQRRVFLSGYHHLLLTNSR